jgi:hypothetical protein
VRTAIYLKEEFKLPRVILDYAVEAWREPTLLQRSGVAVVLPPFPADGRYARRLRQRQLLRAAGRGAAAARARRPVRALRHGQHAAGTSLGDQAGLAHSGGSHRSTPALVGGHAHEPRAYGRRERGASAARGPARDADLVLWSGTPFEPTSRSPSACVLRRKLVLDPRSR